MSEGIGPTETPARPDWRHREQARGAKGLLAVVGLVLLKGFKLLKLGKFGGTAISMVVSIGAYALVFGWRYAAGFVALIFIHEMGHYLAARRAGLAVGAPTFIPFVGAWIELKDTTLDPQTEAHVALAGPLLGTLAAFAVFAWARETDSRLLLALSYSGFFINLFNLAPIHPLDGGRVTGAVSPRIWFVGLPLLIAMFAYRPSPLLVLIGILAIPALGRAWKFDSNAPENAAYRAIPTAWKWETMALYLTLVCVLALMATSTHDELTAVCSSDWCG